MRISKMKNPKSFYKSIVRRENWYKPKSHTYNLINFDATQLKHRIFRSQRHDSYEIWSLKLRWAGSSNNKHAFRTKTSVPALLHRTMSTLKTIIIDFAKDALFARQSLSTKSSSGHAKNSWCLICHIRWSAVHVLALSLLRASLWSWLTADWGIVL